MGDERGPSGPLGYHMKDMTTPTTHPTTFLQAVLNIHMTVTGSYERPDEDQLKDVELVENRLANWEPTFTASSEAFDATVRKLAETALLEHTYFYEQHRSN